MSPIYEDENTTIEDLEKIRRRGKCKVCGANLNMYLDPESGKAFVACWDWLRTQHEGIEREASRYEKEGLSSLNIPTRREMMNQELGPEKTKALDKYEGVVSLTKAQAREILVAVFPDAPGSEITRAVILCASYGLNPLMKHVFLIPFNKGKPNETWATVIGIKAKRLLASRRGSYSYIDNTPRVMTEQEQRTTFGEVEPDKLWVITKGKDPQTGAEVVGYGFWPKDSQPYGTEKGNTKFNMAAIRSESQMLDRLRPGEMPVGIEVMPEEAIEGEYKVIEDDYEEVDGKLVHKKTGEVLPPMPESKPKEHWCEEHNCPFEKKTRGTSTWWAHKLPDGSWCNEAKKKEPAPKAAPHIPDGIGDLPSDEPEPEAEKPQRPQRDPETIRTISELQKALFEDFHLQPKQQLAELNLDSWNELANRPAEAYKQVAASR